MSQLSIEALSKHPLGAAQKERAHDEQVAGQFEAIFVRTMVQSLRQSAKVGSEGGMFGSETGADTYGDWFDDKIAEQVGKAKNGKTSGIGIAAALMQDFARNHELGEQPAKGAEAAKALDGAPKHADALAKATAAAATTGLRAAHAIGKGGIDVLR